MFLLYKDLSRLFPDKSGIKESHLAFQTVSISADDKQPKGIFIPLRKTSGELKKAIENGAVAAIWEKGKDIPKYTPNHFPIFFAENLFQALKDILLQYHQNHKEQNKDKTNFLFLDEKLLNDFYQTYDSPVMEAKLYELIDKIREEKE